MARRYSRYLRRRNRYGRRRRNPFKSKVYRQMRQLDTNRIIINAPTRLISLSLAQGYNPQDISSPTNAPIAVSTPVYIIDPIALLIGGKTSTGTTLAKDVSFNNFAVLFDQFKINAVRMKIVPYSLPQNSNALTNAATFYRTAVDLNGFDPSMNEAKGYQSPIHNPVEGNAFPNFIMTYSSYNQRQVNSTALYPIWQTFYPRGQARNLWLGCSFSFDGNLDHNPHLDFNFKPIFMIQIVTPNITTTGVPNASFGLDIDYDITFKGQRRPVKDAKSESEILNAQEVLRSIYDPSFASI